MTHARPRSVSAVRHALIEARTSREGFEVALAALADLVGAHTALTFVPSFDYAAGYALDMVGWRARELHERAQREAAGHGIIDPWRAGAERLGAFDKPLLCTGEELTSDADMAKSPWGPFFDDFDVRHLLGYTAPARELGAPTVFLSLYRAGRQEAFGEKERRQLRALTAEFDATAELRLSLAPDTPRFDQALIDIAEPAFLVGRGGVVIWANEAGHNLLSLGGLIRMEGNALTAARSDRTEPMRATILRALRGESGILSLIRVAGRHIYLRATPVRVSEQTVVLVRVRDALAPRRPKALDLMALFDLSRAEAEVAVAMCDHFTARQIARQRNVDFETVRTQTRKVCEKIGVRKSAEAVAIMTRLVD